MIKWLPLVAITGLLLAGGHGWGATIHVPGDQPTIAAAIAAASLVDTIQVGAGTFTESGLVVDRPLVIRGAGAGSTIVQAHADAPSSRRAATDRVFHLTGAANVFMGDLTIRHGNPDGPGGGILNEGTLILEECTVSDNASQYGGGIWNSGHLTLRFCQVVANATRTGTGLQGGGIANEGNLVVESCSISENLANSGGGGMYNGPASLVTMDWSQLENNTAGSSGPGGGLLNDGLATLTDCTVVWNTAADGGGLANRDTAALGVVSSLIAANSAGSGRGGGLANLAVPLGPDATTDEAVATLENCTFYSNDSANGGGAVHNHADHLGPGVRAALTELTNCTIHGNSTSGTGGGGILVTSAHGMGSAAALLNTIVAGNTATAGGPDVQGVIQSWDYNLIQDATGGTLGGTFTYTLLGVDPLLGDLGDYGGRTWAFPLLDGSPAIDAGTAEDAPETDQRGYTRVGPTDIGAFEYPALRGPIKSVEVYRVHEQPGGPYAVEITVEAQSERAVTVEVAGQTYELFANGRARGGRDTTRYAREWLDLQDLNAFPRADYIFTVSTLDEVVELSVTIPFEDLANGEPLEEPDEFPELLAPEPAQGAFSVTAPPVQTYIWKAYEGTQDANHFAFSISDVNDDDVAWGMGPIDTFTESTPAPLDPGEGYSIELSALNRFSTVDWNGISVTLVNESLTSYDLTVVASDVPLDDALDGILQLLGSTQDGAWHNAPPEAPAPEISDPPDQNAKAPDVLVDGDWVYCAWQQRVNGHWEVYVKGLDTAGRAQWQGLAGSADPGGISQTVPATDSVAPRMVMQPNPKRLWVVWQEGQANDILDQILAQDFGSMDRQAIVAFVRSLTFEPTHIYAKCYDFGTQAWLETDGSASGAGISGNPVKTLASRPDVGLTAAGEPFVVWDYLKASGVRGVDDTVRIGAVYGAWYDADRAGWTALGGSLGYDDPGISGNTWLNAATSPRVVNLTSSGWPVVAWLYTELDSSLLDPSDYRGRSQVHVKAYSGAQWEPLGTETETGVGVNVSQLVGTVCSQIAMAALPGDELALVFTRTGPELIGDSAVPVSQITGRIWQPVVRGRANGVWHDHAGAWEDFSRSLFQFATGADLVTNAAGNPVVAWTDGGTSVFALEWDMQAEEWSMFGRSWWIPSEVSESEFDLQGGVAVAITPDSRPVVAWNRVDLEEDAALVQALAGIDSTDDITPELVDEVRTALAATDTTYNVVVRDFGPAPADPVLTVSWAEGPEGWRYWTGDPGHDEDMEYVAQPGADGEIGYARSPLDLLSVVVPDVLGPAYVSPPASREHNASFAGARVSLDLNLFADAGLGGGDLHFFVAAGEPDRSRDGLGIYVFDQPFATGTIDTWTRAVVTLTDDPADWTLYGTTGVPLGRLLHYPEAWGIALVGASAQPTGFLGLDTLVVAGGNDVDGDRMPDDWELAEFDGSLDQQGWMDADGDGLNNYKEYVFGTDPFSVDPQVFDSRDSDGDGFRDLAEVLMDSDPTDAASPADTVEISGVISDGGSRAPLAGSLVAVLLKACPHSPTMSVSAPTGVDGAYSVRIPAGVDACLLAVKPGPPPFRLPIFHPHVTQPMHATVFNTTTDMSGVDFSLDPAALVTGQVTDHEGRGLSYARVDALATSPVGAFLDRARTRPDGTYGLLVPANREFTLEAGHQWFHETEYEGNPQTFTLAPNQVQGGVDFQLEFRDEARDHVFFIEMWQKQVHRTPDEDTRYRIEIDVETDWNVEEIEVRCPGGNEFTMPGGSGADRSIESSFQCEMEHPIFEWRHDGDFATEGELDTYGDGWYEFVCLLSDGSTARTHVWFGEHDPPFYYRDGRAPAGFLSFPDPPEILSPPHGGTAVSPIVASWTPPPDDVSSALVYTDDEFRDETLNHHSGPLDVTEGTDRRLAVVLSSPQADVFNEDGVETRVGKFTSATVEFDVLPRVPGTIAVGDTVYGTIDAPDEIDEFTFSATAGQELVVDINARALWSRMDPAFAVYGPDRARALVVRDDDSGDLAGGFGAHLVVKERRQGNAGLPQRSTLLEAGTLDSRAYFTVPATGSYTIEVGDYDQIVDGEPGGSGDDVFYELSLLPAADLPQVDHASVPVTLVKPGPVNQPLTFESYPGDDWPGHMYTWSFTGDPATELPEGTYLIRADYGGGDVRERSFELAPSALAPAFPTVTNPADNATGVPEPVELEWTGTAPDAVEVTIYASHDPVDEEGFWAQYLPPTSTSATIPDDQTDPGNAYTVEVRFENQGEADVGIEAEWVRATRMAVSTGGGVVDERTICHVEILKGLVTQKPGEPESAVAEVVVETGTDVTEVRVATPGAPRDEVTLVLSAEWPGTKEWEVVTEDGDGSGLYPLFIDGTYTITVFDDSRAQIATTTVEFVGLAIPSAGYQPAMVTPAPVADLVLQGSPSDTFLWDYGTNPDANAIEMAAVNRIDDQDAFEMVERDLVTDAAEGRSFTPSPPLATGVYTAELLLMNRNVGTNAEGVDVSLRKTRETHYTLIVSDPADPGTEHIHGIDLWRGPWHEDGGRGDAWIFRAYVRTTVDVVASALSTPSGTVVGTQQFHSHSDGSQTTWELDLAGTEEETLAAFGDGVYAVRVTYETDRGVQTFETHAIFADHDFSPLPTPTAAPAITSPGAGATLTEAFDFSWDAWNTVQPADPAYSHAGAGAWVGVYERLPLGGEADILELDLTKAAAEYPLDLATGDYLLGVVFFVEPASPGRDPVPTNTDGIPVQVRAAAGAGVAVQVARASGNPGNTVAHVYCGRFLAYGIPNEAVDDVGYAYAIEVKSQPGVAADAVSQIGISSPWGQVIALSDFLPGDWDGTDVSIWRAGFEFRAEGRHSPTAWTFTFSWYGLSDSRWDMLPGLATPAHIVIDCKDGSAWDEYVDFSSNVGFRSEDPGLLRPAHRSVVDGDAFTAEWLTGWPVGAGIELERWNEVDNGFEQVFVDDRDGRDLETWQTTWSPGHLDPGFYRLGIWFDQNVLRNVAGVDLLVETSPSNEVYFVVLDEATADDHGNTPGDATSLALGGTVNGEIEYAGDIDVFAVTVTAGETYEARVDLAPGELEDSVLRLYDADGKVLASDDDGGHVFGSRLTWTAADDGTVYVGVESIEIERTGPYALSVGSLDLPPIPPTASYAFGRRRPLSVKLAGTTLIVGADLGTGAYSDEESTDFLHVLDVTNPLVPAPTGSHFVGDEDYTVLDGLTDRLYVAVDAWDWDEPGHAMVLVLDLSVPGDPVLVNAAPLQRADVDALVLFGDRLYACTQPEDESQAYVEAYDITDPDNPVFVSESVALSAPGHPWFDPETAVVEGDRIYVVHEFAGTVTVLDVSSGVPLPIGQVSVDTMELTTVAVSGTTLFAGVGWSLHVLDVADPAAPGPAAALPMGGRVWHIEVHGPVAYVGRAGLGVVAFDVTDPSAPTELLRYGVAGATGDFAMRGGLLYVPTSAGSVEIFVTKVEPTQLAEGWNHVSFPCHTPMTFEEILWDGDRGMVHEGDVLHWDPDAQDYVVTPTDSPPWAQAGYWIRTTADSQTQPVLGTLANGHVQVSAGWNAGGPAVSAPAPQDAGFIQNFWRWNAGLQGYERLGDRPAAPDEAILVYSVEEIPDLLFGDPTAAPGLDWDVAADTWDSALGDYLELFTAFENAVSQLDEDLLDVLDGELDSRRSAPRGPFSQYRTTDFSLVHRRLEITYTGSTKINGRIFISRDGTIGNRFYLVDFQDDFQVLGIDVDGQLELRRLGLGRLGIRVLHDEDNGRLLVLERDGGDRHVKAVLLLAAVASFRHDTVALEILRDDADSRLTGDTRWTEGGLTQLGERSLSLFTTESGAGRLQFDRGNDVCFCPLAGPLMLYGPFADVPMEFRDDDANLADYVGSLGVGRSVKQAFAGFSFGFDREVAARLSLVFAGPCNPPRIEVDRVVPVLVPVLSGNPTCPPGAAAVMTRVETIVDGISGLSADRKTWLRDKIQGFLLGQADPVTGCFQLDSTEVGDRLRERIRESTDWAAICGGR